jgi:hypothetical protein
MDSRQHVIDELALATALDPDTIELALDEVASEFGEDEVNEGIAELTASREIPAGEGLSRKEARKLLISEMNAILQAKNQYKLRKYTEDTRKWYAKKSDGERAGKYPREPIFVNTVGGLRHINQAVNMARHLGGYGELLEVAGYGR